MKDGEKGSETWWFKTFYPKSWGNWKESFNQKKSDDSHRFGRDYKSACHWSHYRCAYNVGNINSFGRRETKPAKGDILHNCFFEVDHYRSDLVPIYQPKNKTAYYQVLCKKMDSNLDLYSIFILGDYRKNIRLLRRDFLEKEEMLMQFYSIVEYSTIWDFRARGVDEVI